jgi:hypothetical protein
MRLFIYCEVHKMESLLRVLENTIDEMRRGYETASDRYKIDVALERGLKKLRQTKEISRIDGLGFLSNWLVESTSDRGFDLMVLDRIEGQKSLTRASA